MGGRRWCGSCSWRQWFGVPQPDISRWLKYWQAARLGQLAQLAQCRGLDGRIGRAHCRGVCHLSDVGRGAGVPAPAPAGGGGDANPRCSKRWRKVAGAHLQQTLTERYDLSGPALCLREGWLVGAVAGASPGAARAPGSGPSPAGRSAHHAGRLDDAGPGGRRPHAATPQDLPWLLRVEQLLSGATGKS